MPDGASRATRLAARAVIAAVLAAVVAAFAMPAVAGAASVAYVDKGEVWLASLDGSQEGAAGDARGERQRRDGGVARRGAVRRRADRGGAQQAGPDVELLLVQDLGARRELQRRGSAQRTGRLGRVCLSARLRHHRGRVAPRLRVLELGRLLPDHVRSWDVRPAGDQQRAQSDRHGQPDEPLALRRAGDLAGTPPLRRSSTSRTRTLATPTRTPSPRGSTPRASGSTSKASTSRPTGAWRRSGSRRTTAARRRSARSRSSRSRGSTRRPRPRPPWTASCPRPASRGTHRSRRTPGRSRGRTTAA